MEELDDKTLDNIVNGAIDAMESSKTQIFDIYENSRAEVDNIKTDIEAVKIKVTAVINRVDELESQELKARNRLVVVSSNFKTYTEEDIKLTYEEAKILQIELAVLREQELNLRQQRDNLEWRLKKLQGTADKAKQLVAQVGVVLGYLSTKMGEVVNQIEAVSQEKVFGAQIIKAQEDERLRVSREIHDGPAQIMANVIYQSGMCERLIDIDGDRAKEGLQELREQIRGCLTEIRKIIFDLRPMSLDDLGLVAAVEQFLEKFEHRFAVKVDFEFIGRECKINKHAEVSLFRIIQESLNNVYKHAAVKKAKLKLIYTSEHITIIVEDKGCGFVMDSLKTEEEKAECYGVMGMKERVKLLKGQFSLNSQPGYGTKLRIMIPIREIKE